MAASATDDDSSAAQTSYLWWRFWESLRDIECPQEGHAQHQAEEIVGPEDKPGRCTLIVVLEPLALSVPDRYLDSRPMAGNINSNPVEHLVPAKNQTSRPMEDVTNPEPLGHSVTLVHLDSRPGRRVNELKPEGPEHPTPEDTPSRIVRLYDNQAVSDQLVDSNTDRSSDPVPMPAPSELAEHSTSVGHNFRRCKPELSGHPVPGGARTSFSDNQTVSDTIGQSRTGEDLVLKPAPSKITEPPEREGSQPETAMVSRLLLAGLPKVIAESQQSKDS